MTQFNSAAFGTASMLANITLNWGALQAMPLPFPGRLVTTGNSRSQNAVLRTPMPVVHAEPTLGIDCRIKSGNDEKVMSLQC
jgi:hypothetical protein